MLYSVCSFRGALLLREKYLYFIVEVNKFIHSFIYDD